MHGPGLVTHVLWSSCGASENQMSLQERAHMLRLEPASRAAELDRFPTSVSWLKGKVKAVAWPSPVSAAPSIHSHLHCIPRPVRLLSVRLLVNTLGTQVTH